MTPHLTPRQQAVVGELMHGSSNKNIAHALGVSEATVKVHLRNVMKKLRVQNRVQVVLRMSVKDKPASPPALPRDVGCW